jgi:hypothetical protein
MPVPPQESAPSLSPRQSFGCQSPLPWVTGTDRTGSLRALWQLQGSFQEFSSPSAHSLTWRSRSQANKPHAVQYCVVTTTHGKHRHRLPKPVQQSQDDLTVVISEQGSTHRLAQLFPNNKDSSTRVRTQASFRECTHRNFSETDTDSTLTGQGVHAFLKDKHRLSFLSQDYTQVSCRLVSTALSSGQSDRMDENPPHGLLSLFYLHAPGLTLVTLGTACVPSVRLPPTTWEITCPSKRT